MKEYINEFDQYMSWIHDELNPVRKGNGVKEITDDKARECWDIMKNFSKQFRTATHTEERREG